MLGNRASIGECKYLPTLCLTLSPTESRKVPDSDEEIKASPSGG